MLEDNNAEEKYMTPLIRKPKGKVAVFFWRIWIWLSTTFALSIMEPWELVLVCKYFKDSQD